MASSAVAYVRENQQRFLNELKELLRIPSVSTTPERKNDVQRAAEFVANDLKRIGMENVEMIHGKGHPLIYADWLHAPGKPTVLCYAHYDVQPPDPLEEWISPPFEPTERNNNIYARGAVDDKGQLWLELKAVESLMRSRGGTLPINVKFILEGEEEVGGESIAGYIRKQKAKLKADFALICDTELFAPDLPTLCAENRPALRDVRWRCSESLLRADSNHQQVKGRQRACSHSRVLLQGEGTNLGRAESLEAATLR
jgi:acetylornithine deacetylase/succinyl-diaminopimelate desuccinylase-like protein